MSDATPKNKARRTEPLAYYEADDQELLDGIASGRLRVRRITKAKDGPPVTWRERLEMIPLAAQQGATFNLADDAMSLEQRARLRKMHHRDPMTFELARLGGALANPINLATGLMAARGGGLFGAGAATDRVQNAYNAMTHARAFKLPAFPIVSGAVQGALFGAGSAEEETGTVDRVANAGMGAGIGAVMPLVLAPLTRAASLGIGSLGRLGPSRSTTLDGAAIEQRGLFQGGGLRGGRFGAGPEIRLRDRVRPRDVANILLEEQALSRGGVNGVVGGIQPADVGSARASSMMDDIMALVDPADRADLARVIRGSRRSAELAEQGRDTAAMAEEGLLALNQGPQRRMIDRRPRSRDVTARAIQGLGADDGVMGALMTGRNTARSARNMMDRAAADLPKAPARPARPEMEPMPTRREVEAAAYQEAVPRTRTDSSEIIAETAAAREAERLQRLAAVARGKAAKKLNTVTRPGAQRKWSAEFERLDAEHRQRGEETMEAQRRLDTLKRSRTVGRSLTPDEAAEEAARVAELNAARRVEAEALAARLAADADAEYATAVEGVRGRYAEAEAAYPDRLDEWRLRGGQSDGAPGKGGRGRVSFGVQGRATDREVEDVYQGTIGQLRSRLSLERREALRQALGSAPGRGQVRLMADRLGLDELPDQIERVSSRIASAGSNGGDTVMAMGRRIAESGGRATAERGADVPLSERWFGDRSVRARGPVRLNRREAKAIVEQVMQMRDARGYGADGSPLEPLPAIGRMDDLFEIGPGRELPRRAGRIMDQGNLMLAKKLKSPATMSLEMLLRGDGIFDERRSFIPFADTDISTPDGLRINDEDTDELSDRVVFMDGQPVAVAPGEAERWRGEARDRRALRAALLERFDADDMEDDIGARSPDRRQAARFDGLGVSAKAEVSRAQGAVARAQRALSAVPRTEENRGLVSRRAGDLSRARGALSAAQGRLAALAERYPDEFAASERYAEWIAEGTDLRGRAFTPVERPRR